MAIRNRLIDIVYQLRDKFTGKVGEIVRGYKQLGDSADTSARRVEKANARMSGSFSAVSSTLGRLAGPLAAAFGSRELIRSVQDFTAEADKLNKVSQKLGISVEDLQVLGFVAEKNGISFDKAATGIQRFTRRLAEVATTGKGEAAGALDALGLSAESLAKLDIEDQLAALADGFANLESQGERVRVAFKLFDTEGVDLVRILQDGSAAFRQTAESARELAVVFDQETANAASRLKDSLLELETRWERFTFAPKAAAVEAANNWLAFFGSFTSKTEELQYRLNELVAEREKAETALANASGRNARNIQGRVDVIQREIWATVALLDKQREKVASLQNEEQANRRAAEVRRKAAASIEETTKALEGQTEALKKNLDEQTKELEKARASQLDIEKEFQDLLRDVTEQPIENVTGFDVQVKANEARRKLVEGDADAALEVARKGAEMLRKLKEDGEESGYVLSFLAKELGRVAEQAAAEKTEVEVIDVDKAQSEVDKIGAAIKAVGQIPLSVTPESLATLSQQIQTTISQAMAAAVQSGVDQGLQGAFSSLEAGRNYADLINAEVSKRGVK